MKLKALGLSSLLVLGLLIVPSASATCPDQPRDCNSIIELLEVPIGDGETQFGIVEYAKQQVEQETGLGRQQQEPSINGRLEPGEQGAIMIIVNTMGGAGQFDIVLPDSVPAIRWLGDSSISIKGAAVEDRFFIPFEVTGELSSNMRFTFTASDDRGNSTGGSLSPFTQLGANVPQESAQTPGPGLLVIPLLAIAALMRRRR